LIGLVFTCGLLCPLGLVLSLLALSHRPRGFAVAGTLVGLVGMLPFTFIFLGIILSAFRGESTRDYASTRADASVAIYDGQFESFPALNVIPDDNNGRHVLIAEFSENGPDSKLAIPTNNELTHLAFDSKRGRYYGTTHDGFGRISAAGSFVEIDVDPSLDVELDSPTGVAYLSQQDSVLVTARSGAYLFSEDTDQWQHVPGFTGYDIEAIAYDTERDVIYALSAHGKRHVKIVEFEIDGTLRGETHVGTKIPDRRGVAGRLQLAYTSAGLVILVTPGDNDAANVMQMYVADPVSGHLQRVVAES